MSVTCGKYQVSDDIRLDRAGYVMAVIGREGQIIVRRRHLLGDDALSLSKWLSLKAYLESIR